MSRDSFEGLLEAMTRSGWIAIEDAEYEKDGEVRRFRKISLTEAGLEVRNASAHELLISDGIAAEFAGSAKRAGKAAKVRAGKREGTSLAETASAELSADAEALALEAAGVACCGGKAAGGSGIHCSARQHAAGGGPGATARLRINCWPSMEWAPPRWRNSARPFWKYVRRRFSLLAA